MLGLAFITLLRQDSNELLKLVQQDRMREVIAHLSAMPNRNTNNESLTQAAEYIAAKYRAIPGLDVEVMKYQAPQGPRVPQEKEVVEVVATLKGESDHKVIVGGHFDSINMVDRNNLNANAPGANDDLSGTSVALECARILANHHWKNTLVFVAFSGEEQGLLGSSALAKRAKDEGWKIDAVLNNDIVGSSQSLNGQTDKHHVRVFSEESTKHNSRELARFIEWNSRGKIHGFSPKMVYRKDRFQRGGDHSSFNDAGFTAVRFTEGVEEFTRQHTTQDLIKFVDFNYLGNVTRVNLLTLATLADAGPSPVGVRMDPSQDHDTTIHWKPAKGQIYTIYSRDSASPAWSKSLDVDASTGEIVIKKQNKDDTFFAVGAKNGVPIDAH